LSTWNDLTEPQKLETVKAVIEGLVADGQKVTGVNVGVRIGAAERTGRSYLRKLQEVEDVKFLTQPERTIPQQRKVYDSVETRPYNYDIVCMPDVQAPFHDKALVEKFTNFIADFQPFMLAQVGDFTDSTEISVWAEGLQLEYAGGLQDGLDQAEGILRDIRSVYDGRMVIVRSNHDDRLHRYIAKNAPGLADLRSLTIENLLHLDELNVEFSHRIVDLAPGWIMAHGDEGGLSGVAGQTAMKLARQCRQSTVCGHSHRAGITSETTGYNGTSEVLTGLEVGHFMDLDKATYLKRGSGNWQQAFGILRVRGGNVYPELVSVIDGHFVVDGTQY
jgi:hypothetical protein